MNDEEWAALESSWWDRVRVLGFTVALGTRADAACERAERAVSLLIDARARAVRALADAHKAAELAELSARMISRNDEDEFARFAAQLKEALG